MALIGHNGGPSVEPGEAWRRHCWTAARARWDRVILVGDMALEGDWAMAARLAAYLPAERYFA